MFALTACVHSLIHGELETVFKRCGFAENLQPVLRSAILRACYIGKRKVGVAGGCGSPTERDSVVIVLLTSVGKGEILAYFGLNGWQRRCQWRRSRHRHWKWREYAFVSLADSVFCWFWSDFLPCLLPTLFLSIVQDDDGSSSLGGNQFLSEVSVTTFCLLLISAYFLAILLFFSCSWWLKITKRRILGGIIDVTWQ